MKAIAFGDTLRTAAVFGSAVNGSRSHDEVGPSSNSDVIEWISRHSDDVRARARPQYSDVITAEQFRSN